MEREATDGRTKSETDPSDYTRRADERLHGPSSLRQSKISPRNVHCVCASVRQGRCLVARALAPGCSDSRWIDQIIDHSTAELDLFSRSLSPSTVFIYLFIYYVYIQQRQHQWVYRSCCYRFDPSPSRVTRADASSHPEKILKEKKRINGGKHNDRDGKLVRRRGHTHAVYTTEK